MQLITSFLLAIGAFAGRAAFLRIFIEKISTVYLARSNMQQRLIKWVVGALGTGATVESAGEYFEEQINWLYEGVRSYLENMLGEVVNEISKADILEAAGKAGAREIGRQILKKYGISFPITNLLSDEIAEELGKWFADLINIELSKKVGYEVKPFTTLFPMDKIVPEFDAFVTSGLNNALGTNIESVMDFQNLKSQVESAVFNRITDLVNEKFTTVKSDIMIEVEVEINKINAELDLPEAAKDAISKVISDKLTDMALNLNSVLPTNIKAKKFYFNPTKRLYAKLRQQKYRKTHRQQTRWVLKDAPADPLQPATPTP